MKHLNKILCLLFLSINITAFSQPCTPDTNIVESGFYPEQLDTVIPETNYVQVLQIRVIKDTIVEIFGFPQQAYVDSIVLKNIVGLPQGFTYKCYNERCRFVPDTTGCAVLTGQADANQVGVYPLKLAVDIYGRLASGFKAVQGDTIRNLTLVVSGNTGSVEYTNAQRVSVFPMPMKNGNFSLSTAPSGLPATLRVYTMDGKLILQQQIDAEQTGIALGRDEKATYFMHLRDKNGTIIWKGKVLNLTE